MKLREPSLSVISPRPSRPATGISSSRIAGLVIRHAEVLRPVLRRDVDRHAGGQRAIDHRLVDALGVQIDLDRAGRTRATPSNTVCQKS